MGSEIAVCGLESLDRGINLGNTIPKSQQMQKETSYFIAGWIAFFGFFSRDLHLDLSSGFLTIDSYYYGDFVIYTQKNVCTGFKLLISTL